MGASKLSGKVAEVGWRFTEVASQKVTEVSGAVSEKVIFHDKFFILHLFCVLLIHTFKFGTKRPNCTVPSVASAVTRLIFTPFYFSSSFQFPRFFSFCVVHIISKPGQRRAAPERGWKPGQQPGRNGKIFFISPSMVFFSFLFFVHWFPKEIIYIFCFFSTVCLKLA